MDERKGPETGWDSAALVRAFREIGRTILQTEDQDEILDVLVESIVEASRLRSLAISLVAPENRKVTVVRQVFRQSEDGELLPFSSGIVSQERIEFELEDSGPTQEVVETGQRLVIEGYDRRFGHKDGILAASSRATYEDKVSYFLPVSGQDGVIAVLATASTRAEQEAVTQRLDAMGPLLDQFAVALEHSRLIGTLRTTAEGLDQTNRVLQASQEIGRNVLQATTLDEIVEELMFSVGHAGLFRSLSFAVVDYEQQVIRLLRTMRRGKGDDEFQTMTPPPGDVTRSLPLSSTDVLAETVRTGRPITIQGWDPRLINAAPGTPQLDPATYVDKVSYFIPIKSGKTVTGALATASTIAQREETEARIRAMQPLFEQIAIAVDHARLVDDLSGEADRLDTLAAMRENENLILLEISQLVQAMNSVPDIERVIRGISTALSDLEMPYAGLTIHRIVDESADLVESHHLRPDAAYRINLHQRSETVEEWRDQRIRYWPDVESNPGSLGQDYRSQTYQSHALEIGSVITVPFAHGVLTIRAHEPDAYPESRHDLLRKLGSMLSVGLSRLRDLEQIEGKSTEQDAIIAISRSVLNMRKPEDVATVMETFVYRARQCGVAADVVTYNVFRDPESALTSAYQVNKDNTFATFDRQAPRIWEWWRSGETKYILNDDIEAHGIQVRSSLHTPNAGGVLSVMSESPEAFPEATQELVDRLSEPLALGFARQSDIEQVEARASEIAEQEANVRQEKEFSEDLLTSMREGLCVLSRDGGIVDVNPALCDMTGFSREELVGCAPPHPFWPRAQSRRMRATMLRAARGEMRDYELELVRKDGSTFAAHVAPSRTKGTGGREVAYFATIRDLTAEKELQVERAHSQRLRVIGELSAGVSHNLNNMLTSIIGPAQLLEMKTDDKELLRDIETIQFSAARAADLVKRLSWTTAERREELGPVDVVETVKEAVRSSEPKWRDEAEMRGVQITIDTELGDMPFIRGTQAGLHDMLLNLIFNSVDAMPHGGGITIEASASGSEVILRIRDTGTGMDERTRRRVFEPFFTTKMDVGSGLGLSTLFGTLRGWGGAADVTSEVGRGTVFTLRFKVWTETGKPAPAKSNETGAPPPSGRILVVDDDAFVGEFLTSALKHNHSVYHESNAPRSLDIVSTDSHDVAVIDLGMPHITGDALARKIRKIDSCISLVTVTGWDLDATDPRLEPFDDYLQKPFDSIHQVEQTIHNAIMRSRMRRERAGKESPASDPE